MMLPVVCIMGPTASGKSKLAMDLAAELRIEIISVDSAMIYRELNIGTAKPSQHEQVLVPHHLIDICEPYEIYSAGDFCRDAEALITAVEQRGNLPILVGGTMMYFYLLQNGVAALPAADPVLRQQISVEAKSLGWPAMHAKLALVDPAAASRIEPNDQQRIQRALEVSILTGKTLSALQDNTTMSSSQKFINIALMPATRSILHEQIARRFDKMLELGFIDEVKRLHKRQDLTIDLPAMRCVGYRQVWNYLDGSDDFETMKNKAIAATRQLAKRQITWLRRWQNLNWFDSHDPQLLPKVVSLITAQRQ